MDSALLRHLTCHHDSQGRERAGGFSLLEMMMVVTLILIIASIATPIYRSVVVRTRERVATVNRFLVDRGLFRSVIHKNPRSGEH